MTSSDVPAQPFKKNGLWQFYPLLAFQEGEPDSAPLGPFKVVGDYEIKKEGKATQRFLLVQPPEGCKFPAYETYAVEYPENLIAGECIFFERKRSARRIRAKFSGIGVLKLRRQHLPVREYVLYEEQVEGTWIPIEANGRVLRP